MHSLPQGSHTAIKLYTLRQDVNHNSPLAPGKTFQKLIPSQETYGVNHSLHSLNYFLAAASSDLHPSCASLHRTSQLVQASESREFHRVPVCEPFPAVREFRRIASASASKQYRAASADRESDSNPWSCDPRAPDVRAASPRDCDPAEFCESVPRRTHDSLPDMFP